MVEDFSEVGVLTFLWATQFCSSWNITKFPVSFRKGDDCLISPQHGVHLAPPFPLDTLPLHNASLCQAVKKRFQKNLNNNFGQC